MYSVLTLAHMEVNPNDESMAVWTIEMGCWFQMTISSGGWHHHPDMFDMGYDTT